MVKLRVSVGGTYTDLAIVNCNDELQPIEFDAPNFKGRAVVRIKDFGKQSCSFLISILSIELHSLSFLLPVLVHFTPV